MNTHLFTCCLYLADTALVLGQRNAEWTGHGPVLEQDIAITNISLDLLGQARNFYQHAASLYNDFGATEKAAVDQYIPRLWKAFNRELQEDDLAFLREERQFLNLLITELPKGDWAQTVLRQFLFSSFQYYYYQQLQNSSASQLAAIAEKSFKETTYHLRWSGEWVIRLGDGTEESNSRMQKAMEEIWPFTGEMFNPSGFEKEAAAALPDLALVKEQWGHKIEAVFAEATLATPATGWMQQGGKEGKHTEHLGYLLAEMQYLQRTYPNATW